MRTAVVTGGIGGLGTAICKTLAAQGMQVIAADLAARAERVEQFKAEVAEFGGKITFEACMPRTAPWISSLMPPASPKI